MLTTKSHAILGLILRVIIGGVLFYAGLSKVLEPFTMFASAIQSYHFVPGRMIGFMAFFLPWVEMIVGTYLIMGFWTRAFAGVAAVILTVYLMALTATLIRGIQVGSCVCFGSGQALSPHQTIGLDTLLVVACLILIQICRTPQMLALDTWIRK